jgi:hypothetical protein
MPFTGIIYDATRNRDYFRPKLILFESLSTVEINRSPLAYKFFLRLDGSKKVHGFFMHQLSIFQIRDYFTHMNKVLK